MCLTFEEYLTVMSTSQLETAAATFKALGHPKRLAIVQWLYEQQVACCSGDPYSCRTEPITCDFTDLVDRLDVTKATISHHVKKLSEAGVITCQREGRLLCCGINWDRLEHVQNWFSGSESS